MKNITNATRKANAKAVQKGIANAYLNYSAKCAISCITWAEKKVATFSKLVDEVENGELLTGIYKADEASFVIEANRHAISFAYDVLAILADGVIANAPDERSVLDAFAPKGENMEEVIKDLKDPEFLASAKAGKITADDIRQHAE
jgi:hypothetical protein